MAVRYALLIDGSSQELVHLTEGDETKMTLCGLFASFGRRFSRRAAKQVAEKPVCLNCLRAIGSDE